LTKRRVKMIVNKMEQQLTSFPTPDYRESFICPFHNCMTNDGWCWECAVETYGYEEAKRIKEAISLTRLDV